MPRPGPRPYECVRRAWHSDRHHPIRGSLIQEIFRIANEVHSPGTRKNIEWQEKLPIVVLKAEEIMYSKANSEAEYSDLKTLWERVNDAIDTIIRRDEGSETGEFLQPCIEAALHLGCTPRRSSRSQRNESPRSYLRPETADHITSLPPPTNLNEKSCGNHPTTNNVSLMLHYPQYLTHNPSSFPTSDNNLTQSRNCNPKFPILIQEFAPEYNHPTPAHAYTTSKTWSVYPLYYFNQFGSYDPKLDPKRPWESYSNLVPERNLCISKLDTSDFSFPSKQRYNLDKVPTIECDLTLRLGPFGGSVSKCSEQ